jgi:hypothetical protein
LRLSISRAIATAASSRARTDIHRLDVRVGILKSLLIVGIDRSGFQRDPLGAGDFQMIVHDTIVAEGPERVLQIGKGVIEP